MGLLKRYFEFSLFMQIFNLPEVANYWDQVVKINKWQKDRIYKKIVENIW